VRKKFAAVALAAASALFISGCAEPPADDATTAASGDATTSSSSDFMACMISDSGGFDDKSFNQSGYEGLERAESELGITIKTAESQEATDFGPNLQSMETQGCGLTITVGFLLAEATKAQAEASPDSHFAIIDDNSIVLPNVKPLVFKTSDASFLAGYLAAGYSKTGTVATFGGQNIPSVSIFMDGFVDGVAKYNEDNGASVQVLGWDKAAQNGTFTGDFSDQSKGQNTTTNFIDQGADVIMPVAGPVGLGAAAAAQESGKASIIWVDADGYETNPQYQAVMLTSVMKEIGQAVFDTIEGAEAGEFSSDPYIGTLENGGVGLAPYHDFDSQIPDDLKTKVEDLKAQIISGDLKVTSPNDPQ
jgi:basic membrane protein A